MIIFDGLLNTKYYKFIESTPDKSGLQRYILPSPVISQIQPKKEKGFTYSASYYQPFVNTDVGDGWKRSPTTFGYPIYDIKDLKWHPREFLSVLLQRRQGYFEYMTDMIQKFLS